MWVLILSGLVVSAILFFLSSFTGPGLFFSFRYIGLIPILLALIFMKPVTRAFKQDQIPASRGFRNVYALIAMISLIVAVVVWFVFIVLQFVGTSTPWIGFTIAGVALFAVPLAYVIERNGYYSREYPEVMKTFRKARRFYEGGNISIEYKRDISSYFCNIYRDLLGSQITGFCICDAQGRLVTDSTLIEQMGKAVNLAGKYDKKFQVLKELEEELQRIDEHIDQIDEFLKDFADLERAVYPDEDLHAIWFEINEHAEQIIKHGLLIEKMECEQTLAWLDEFAPEHYITEQDIQIFEQVLLSVYEEIEPLDEELMNLVAGKCRQFQEEIEAEDLTTEMDISAYNQRHNHYFTRVVNLLLGIIEQTGTNQGLPNISFSAAERVLLQEKMAWARERISY